MAANIYDRIVIREIDETSPGSAADITDIAYIPGFASTVSNQTILTKAGQTPATESIEAGKDRTVKNILDLKSWTAVNTSDSTYVWEEDTEYVKPYPVNEPTLCKSIQEFETYFGKYAISLEDQDFYTVNVKQIVKSKGKEPTDACNYHAGEYAINTADNKVWNLVETTSQAKHSEFTQCTAESEFDSNTVYYTKSGETYTKAASMTADKFNANKTSFYTDTGRCEVVVTREWKLAAETVTDITKHVPAMYDKSYIYAKELLNLGLPVMYEAVEVKDFTPKLSDIYTRLSDGAYDNLKDKGEYTLKYITSGGYPVFSIYNNTIADKMIDAAESRGDCVAIIDHTNEPDKNLAIKTGSVFDEVDAYVTNTDDKYSFATMFTPWATYGCNSKFVDPSVANYSAEVIKASTQVMPASFGYLMALAKSIKVNPNWYAIAGVTRGAVPNIKSLNTLDRLTNAIADSYQQRTGVSINPITNIKPYGLTIYGNRTLKRNPVNLTATSFLNIRNLVSEVKKISYTAAKSLMFEQNNDILWINFQSKISSTLDKMISGAGISGYKIIKGETDEKAKLVAIIRLFPVYAVESFDITVVMADEEVSVG